MSIRHSLRRFIPRYEVGLGVVASVEFLVRVLPDLSLQRISDSVVLPVIASIFVDMAIPPSAISTVLTWSLLLLVCYTFAQSVYPDRLQDVTSRRGFRLLVSLGALTVAVLTGSLFTLRSRPSTVEAWFLALVLIVAIGSGLLIYLRYVQSERLLAPRGDAISLLIIMDEHSSENPREEVARYQDEYANRSRWLSTGYSLLLLVAMGILYVFPVLLLGAMVALISTLFPLMELLVFGWVANRLITERFGDELSRWLPTNRLLDVENRFYNTISEGMRYSSKGPVAIAIPLVGMITTTASYLFGLSAVWIGYSLLIEQGIDFWSIFAHQWDQLILRGWGILGLFVVYSLMGVYGIWFWYRMLKRFSAFLTAWEIAVQETEVGLLSVVTGRTSPKTEDYLRNSVARPPDYMLLPTLLFLSPIVIYLMLRNGVVEWFTFGVWGVLWPLLLVGTVKSISWTTKIEPQPPLTDQRALPIASIVGMIPLLSYAVGGGLLAWPSTLLLIQVIVVPWLFFAQDVRSWIKKRENGGLIGYASYLTIPGVLLLIGSNFVEYNTVVMGIGTVVLLSGVILLASDVYFDALT